MGMNKYGDSITIKASITYIRHDEKPWYNACPTLGCNKKVTENMNLWRCEKCNKDFVTVR
jgi:replication factor A1